MRCNRCTACHVHDHTPAACTLEPMRCMPGPGQNLPESRLSSHARARNSHYNDARCMCSAASVKALGGARLTASCASSRNFAAVGRLGLELVRALRSPALAVHCGLLQLASFMGARRAGVRGVPWYVVQVHTTVVPRDGVLVSPWGEPCAWLRLRFGRAAGGSLGRQRRCFRHSVTHPETTTNYPLNASVQHSHTHTSHDAVDGPRERDRENRKKSKTRRPKTKTQF